MLMARFCFALAMALVAWGQTARAGEPASPPFGIDRLIAQAIRNHPSIAASRAELDATQAEIAAARGQYWPTPSVQVLRDQGETATVLTLQQPLWAGGRLDAGLAAAEGRARSAEHSIADARYALALRVTAAWGAWMQARGRAEALAEGADLLKVYAASVSRRIISGASAEVDRALVAARLAQTQGDLAAARSAARGALGRLAQWVGQPLRGDDLSAGPAAGAANDTGAETPVPALDALVAQAVARSATLGQLDADLDTARHEVAIRRASLWPTLSLRAQHQRGGGANDSRVMLALDYTPGAGPSAGAQVDAAESRLIGLRASREAARLDLVEKIGVDYEEYLSSRDRRRDVQRSIQASAEVLASYDRLFVAGKRNWLDVINAARELILARTTLADVDAQRLAARTRLRLHAGEPF